MKFKHHLNERCFGLAMACLKKAEKFTPNDYVVQKGLGELNFRFAYLKSDPENAVFLIQKSKQFYSRAFDLNPLDAEAAYGLARAETNLEKLFRDLHPENNENPYRPLPYYNQTIRLRPNGILYQYAMARYLSRNGKTDELSSVIRNLTRAYPPIYFDLKKKDVWSPVVRDAVKQGLEKAITEKIALRDAYDAMSTLMAEEQNWAGALTYYQELLRIQTFQNKPGHYLRLGALYLRNQEFQEAATAFARAIDISSDRVQDFEKVYRNYKKMDRPDQFYLFYQQICNHFILPFQTEILKARCLIDQQQYVLAKQVLTSLNRQAPHAEAYYWLARIAEKEKDFDAMELAGQKATLIEPENSRYHLLFSKALNHLKKFERAEKEAQLAIEHSIDLNPWLYNHRAWIRWKRKNYAGAVSDWQRAIHTAPQRPDFYAYIAEAYRKESRKTLVKQYYQKALNLDPDNQEYQKRLIELENEGT